MTVYRRNPLLMTVMGANPGRRPARRRNPSLGASLAGGLAGAFVTHAFSNPSGPGRVDEDGARELQLYIENDAQLYERQFVPIVKNLMKRRANGTYNSEKAAKLFLYLVDEGSKRYRKEFGTPGVQIFNLATRWEVAKALRDSFEAEAGLGNYDKMTWGVSNNPGGPSFIVMDSGTGRVMYTKRATGTGDAAIKACFVAANHLSQTRGGAYIIFLDLSRARVGDFRSVAWARMQGITGEVLPRNNPRKSSPKKIRRPARPSRPGLKPVKVIQTTTTQKTMMNPGPRGKRKITMTIEQFAKWVKAKRDPAMWRAFLAKFKGYEKWTHGSRSRKVTVEWQNVPGVDGLWITYDGGKQPESTYIMPKGSKRKGAWKHPWDTMPDIKHDPEAGVVLTKLRGRSKITDFYHR